MATFNRNKKTGTWRAQVCVDQTRRSQAGFPDKPSARVWANGVEAELHAGKLDAIPNKTFGDLLERYQREVTPRKRGHRWEDTRLNAFLRDRLLSGVALRSLGSTDVADWRDRRLKVTSPGSVRREWGLLSAVCNRAKVEWRWLTANPFSEVKQPGPPPARDRILKAEELALLEMAVIDHPQKLFYPRVFAAAQFAIETGMRAGEIVGLRWTDIDLEKRIARLDRELTNRDGVRVFATKSGRKREVALSERATGLIKACRFIPEFAIFGLNSSQLDTHWRALVEDAGLQDLHFHDTRHTAITRLAEKLDVLELARMVGVRDPKILMVYYNKSAEEIAKKL